MQGIGRANEVRAIQRRSVGGGVLDGDGAGAAGDAIDHKADEARTFIAIVNIGTESQIALEIGIDEADHRVGQSKRHVTVARPGEIPQTQVVELLREVRVDKAGGQVGNREGVGDHAIQESHGQIGDAIVILARQGGPIGGGSPHGNGAVSAVAPNQADDGADIGGNIGGRGKTQHAGVFVVINHRERGGRRSQRGAQGNILTAQIKLIGPAGVGQLELRVEVARGLVVFDDADRDG